MNTMRNRIALSFLGLCVLISGSTVAQRPENNIDPHRHPILADAQRLCDEAFHRV